MDTKQVLLKLVDLVKDINYSIGVLVQNPENKEAKDSILKVCAAVGRDLCELEFVIERSSDGEKKGRPLPA